MDTALPLRSRPDACRPPLDEGHAWRLALAQVQAAPRVAWPSRALPPVALHTGASTAFPSGGGGTPVRWALRPGIVARVNAVARPDLEAERLLCERAGQGDRAALGQLLRRYGPVLYRSVLLPRLGSEAVAQDALAETYARVVERFSQFQWQSCGFYPWLRVVGLRIALDALRSRRREALFEPDDLQREIDAAETDLTARGEAELCERRDLADARARVDHALGRLNPRYAEAIRLRVLEERPREEVAQALGVSVATFDVVLHRAMTALKKVLAAGLADDLDPTERPRAPVTLGSKKEGVR